MRHCESKTVKRFEEMLKLVCQMCSIHDESPRSVLVVLFLHRHCVCCVPVDECVLRLVSSNCGSPTLVTVLISLLWVLQSLVRTFRKHLHVLDGIPEAAFSRSHVSDARVEDGPV